MCMHCDGSDDRIDVDEESAPYMIHETSTVALQAAAAFSNGWRRGAKGLLGDMISKWGMPGAVRLAYVWGSAMYFLQRPPDAPDPDTGHARMKDIARDLTGEEPDDAHVARLVVVNDQAVTIAKRAAEAASKGEVAEVSRLLGEADAEVFRAVMATLLTEAAFGLRYSRDVDDTLSMDVFMAHVNADMPEDDEPDDDERGNGRGPEG
ncbi:hypothetical protein AB0M39_38060 [Streptomyces sp. NPDC051907]|uniref:hypothetical protein n=1 Tax=Streptomyces sp. NPDC051907 TaxID=3155284 RepID=UPI003448A0C0